MSKVAISTGMFFFEDIFLWLKKIKEAGFDYIELCTGIEKDGRPIHFDFYSTDAVERLKNELTSLELKVLSFHLPYSEFIDLSASDENIRKQAVSVLKRCTEVLLELGGEVLIAHPTTVKRTDELTLYRLQENYTKTLEEIADFIERSNVKLASENLLPHFYFSKMDEILSVVRNFPAKNFGVCVDTGHAYLSMKDVASFIDSTGRIFLYHIHDNKGTKDDHYSPGSGSIKWSDISYRFFRNSVPKTLEVFSDEELKPGFELLVKARKSIEII
ncbi:MAG: sugar phosphate isomerase/epimerase [bacterium]|nr:sugar phosphate isomerase/epimerase [bacterium]